MTKQKTPVRGKRAQPQRAASPGTVGIRELKARASAIVAEVREDGVSYSQPKFMCLICNICL